MERTAAGWVRRKAEEEPIAEHLSIVCTMVDHDTPPAPSSLQATDDLAALHRELAANVPLGGHGPALAGAPPDRNAELRLSPPFPLHRLAGE